MLRREKEQRQEFEQLLKNQEVVLTECEVLLAETRGKPGLTVERRRTLAKTQKRQKLLGTNLGAVARRFQTIVVEVQNNHLEEEDGPIQRRLEGQIILPMLELSGEAMPSAARRLDQTRRLAAEAAKRDEALDAAIAQQRQIVAMMRVVLMHMVESESYQEAVNLLYEIVKLQQDLRKMTAEKIQERIRQIIEGGGSPPENEESDHRNHSNKEPEK